MHRRTFQTIAFIAGGLLMAQAALALELTSPAFKQGEKIPSKYTCDAQGGGVNPVLVFGAVPAGTKQLVLTMHDPDVPKNLRPDGNFDHWLVWDIAPTSKGIAEGAGTKMGINGTGKPGYIGPCPPDREHRYFFRLYAVDAPMMGKTFKDRTELEAAIKGHVVAQAELMGRYEKIKK